MRLHIELDLDNQAVKDRGVTELTDILDKLLTTLETETCYKKFDQHTEYVFRNAALPLMNVDGRVIGSATIY